MNAIEEDKTLKYFDNTLKMTQSQQSIPPYFKKIQDFPKRELDFENDMVNYIGHYGLIKKIIRQSPEMYPNCIFSIGNDRTIIIWNVEKNKKELSIFLNFNIEDLVIAKQNYLIIVGEKIVKYDLKQQKIISEINRKIGRFSEYSAIAELDKDTFIVSSLMHYFVILDFNNFTSTKKIPMYNVHYLCELQSRPPEPKMKKTKKKEDKPKEEENEKKEGEKEDEKEKEILEEKEEEEHEEEEEEKVEVKEEDPLTQTVIKRLASGKCLKTKDGHRGLVYHMISLNNSKYKNSVITAGEDPQIKIMEIDIGTINSQDISYHIYNLVGHSDTVSTITLCENNNYLLSGGYDWTVRKWDLNTLECLKVIEMHHGRISSVISFNNYFLSFSSDKKVNLYDQNGELIKRFIYSEGVIYAGDFYGNNQFIFGDDHGNLFMEEIQF
ncbi:MAG: hypothetical protein MJ252_06340 [archaeon]|nr:hypothetical protein [archaeon]